MNDRFRHFLLLIAAAATWPLAAAEPELPDPTNPVRAVVHAAPASGVQSILITPQRKQAVINGQTLGVGDRMGNAVIVDILPYEVILNRAGQESRLRLIPRLDKQTHQGGAS